MTKYSVEPGQKFTRWTAIRYTRGANGKPGWLCQCECGNTSVITACNLASGMTKSCGCLKAELTTKRLTKHGHNFVGKRSLTYSAWCGMRSRCTDPNHHKYPAYGGRGISICARWNDFAVFLEDMGEKPAGKSLDRYPDVNGSYSPDNCRWATPSEQARNRRSSRIVEFNGHSKTLVEWSEVTGLSCTLIGYRLKAGWPVEQALTLVPDASANKPKHRRSQRQAA